MRGGSAVLPKYRERHPSRNVWDSKRSSSPSGTNILGGGEHGSLKLGLPHISAHRYYSTTLSSGNGTRKERKGRAHSPIVAKISPELSNDKLLLESSMKRREIPKSPTTSPNASGGTVNNGLPGVAFDSLRNLEKLGGKYRKLIHIIADVDMLIYAYELIKSKPGNMTTAVDKETLDGINKEWFQKASQALITGEYEFGKKNRPRNSLTISNPRDKIIQKACEIVLSYIYENKLHKFSDMSHGFRPNRGCHTALEQIKLKWKAIPWYIEFDLKKAFDTINRKKLINILEEEIADQALMALINKMLNSAPFWI